jgi:hypothetical protein
MGSGPLLFSPAIAYHFYFKRGREALMSDPIVVLMLIAVLIVWAGGGLGWILPIGFLRKDDDVSRNQRFWGRVIFFPHRNCLGRLRYPQPRLRNCRKDRRMGRCNRNYRLLVRPEIEIALSASTKAADLSVSFAVWRPGLNPRRWMRVRVAERSPESRSKAPARPARQTVKGRAHPPFRNAS